MFNFTIFNLLYVDAIIALSVVLIHIFISNLLVIVA